MILSNKANWEKATFMQAVVQRSCSNSYVQGFNFQVQAESVYETAPVGNSKVYW